MHVFHKMDGKKTLEFPLFCKELYFCVPPKYKQYQTKPRSLIVATNSPKARKTSKCSDRSSRKLPRDASALTSGKSGGLKFKRYCSRVIIQFITHVKIIFCTLKLKSFGDTLIKTFKCIIRLHCHLQQMLSLDLICQGDATCHSFYLK